MHTQILVGKPDVDRRLTRLDADGRAILKWILWNWGRTMWTGLIWFGIETIGRLF
jgi:hypothetical protein